MKDYHEQLITFAFPDSKEQTEEYFNRYWLNKAELIEIWQNIKDTIYNGNFNILPNNIVDKDSDIILMQNISPDKIFKEGFNSILLKGGIIFTQEDFELLQHCMTDIADEYFIILEDYDENNPPHNSGPPLRFKYPADISWREMNISEGICYELFQRPVRNYFVFGDTGEWGKYVANDYRYPLDIIGFKKENSDLFYSKFKITDEDKKDLREWLPAEYQKYLVD